MKDPTYHQRMGGRTKAKIELLRNHWDVKDKNCVDIGAGRGDITEALLFDQARKVIAIELSDSFFDKHNRVRSVNADIVYAMASTDIEGFSGNEYDVTLCLAVIHHVIGNHGWAVTLETWDRILKVSGCVYFEIGLPSERGSFYWKDKMKGMSDQDVLDKFADGCATFDRIGQLPIHGVPRPIFYVEK